MSNEINTHSSFKCGLYLNVVSSMSVSPQSDIVLEIIVLANHQQMVKMHHIHVVNISMINAKHCYSSIASLAHNYHLLCITKVGKVDKLSSFFDKTEKILFV